MEQIQAIKVRLSNGTTGTFYGAPLTGFADHGVVVVGVELGRPRHVAGLTLRDEARPVVAVPAVRRRKKGRRG